MEYGELDFGFVQSDVHYQAYKGLGRFAKQKQAKKLRSVFSLVQEPLFIVARADAGIKKIEDLKGKRVNLGNRGSGQMDTVNTLMDALGWTKKDFASAEKFKSNEQKQALCSNKVDAVFFTVANYSEVMTDLTESCDTVIVAADGGVIDDLIAKHPYYVKMVIPGRIYRGTPNDVPTFGVRTTFVSNVTVPDDIVYQIVKSVFDNLETFKKTNLAFSTLKKNEMIGIGLTAPRHKGAKKYFEEAGLL